MCVIASLVAMAGAPAAAAENGRNVLVLYSSTRALPQNIISDRGLREALERPAKPRVEVFTEYLDVPRFSGETYVRTVAAFLREKYSSRPPDVIVASGDIALGFLLKNRAEAVRIATVQYKAGRRDLLWVAQLQTAALAAEADLIKLNSAQRTNRVRLHRALGGSFDASPAVTISGVSLPQ